MINKYCSGEDVSLVSNTHVWKVKTAYLSSSRERLHL